MPSRMIDFDGLWSSDKLANCEESIRVEYSWLYGLADCNGSFELNLRSILAHVSAIRPSLSMRRLQKIFSEFEHHGLLFVWTSTNGKKYAHWTGSDRPGRLPPAKERHRYKKFAPPTPSEGLTAYESRFNRDANPDAGREASHDSLASASRIGIGVELVLDRKGVGDGVGHGEGVGPEGGTRSATNISASHESEPKPIKALLEKIKNQTRPQNYCDDCDQSFPGPKEFMAHDCSAKTRGGYECRDCKATFPSVSGLRLHRRDGHITRGIR